MEIVYASRYHSWKGGALSPESPTLHPKHQEPRTPNRARCIPCTSPPGQRAGTLGPAREGHDCAGSPHQQDTWAPAAASAAASAAATLSCAAAAVCRMLITGTMQQRKSGRSGTMSRPWGLSQARRDRGRICRSQGPSRRRLCGGAVRGFPSVLGRRAGRRLSLLRAAFTLL